MSIKTLALAIFSFSVVFFASIASAADSVTVTETDAAITISRGDMTVLVYHKAEVPPPEGIDPIYTRSGFIHPLCAPSGGELTGIHPADHYHHLGLWHAWVKTKHGEDDIDFWNLKAGTGRIRFAGTVSIDQGDGHAGFTVQQEHIKYTGEEKKETVVLREDLAVTVRVEEGANVIDYTTKQTNVTGEALKLPAYRYGGCIAFRSALHWDKTNSDYLTSEGKTRVDGHATRSKWCSVWGPTDKGMATLTFLCPPDNHDFPQRMRIWPEKSNKGTIFFNYVPMQETDWAIEAGQTIVMRYRMIAQDGKATAAEIEKRWEAFAR